MVTMEYSVYLSVCASVCMSVYEVKSLTRSHPLYKNRAKKQQQIKSLRSFLKQLDVVMVRKRGGQRTAVSTQYQHVTDRRIERWTEDIL